MEKLLSTKDMAQQTRCDYAVNELYDEMGEQNGTRDQQVVKALSGLQLAYRDSLSKSQLKFYADMLRDIHPVVLDKAIKKLICTSKFLPT